jgi:hypothetical protein
MNAIRPSTSSIGPSELERGPVLPSSRDLLWNGDRKIFVEKLALNDNPLFEKVWRQAQIRFPAQPTVASIEKALRETCIYSGKGVEVLGESEDAEIRAIVQYLLGRGEISRGWVNRRNLLAAFVKKDPALLSKVLVELRATLDCCGKKLPVNAEEEIAFQSLVGNIVALLPYCYPEKGQEINIPLKIDGVWKHLPYRVDKKFDLTPKRFSPIAAYGLVSEEGPPLLSFLGTTYPAGDGYAATLFSDFTPGLSVGHAPFLFGKKEIGAWLEDKAQVRVFGVSLGGALAFQTLRAFKEKIGSLEVYNPPGLYSWNWTESYNEDGPKVNIYYQENDLVASMGYFPKGSNVHVYRVIPEKERGVIEAHIRAFSGSEKVSYLKSDPAYENSRPLRKILTFLHLVLTPLFCLGLLLPLYLIYRILWLITGGPLRDCKS